MSFKLSKDGWITFIPRKKQCPDSQYSAVLAKIISYDWVDYVEIRSRFGKSVSDRDALRHCKNLPGHKDWPLEKQISKGKNQIFSIYIAYLFEKGIIEKECPGRKYKIRKVKGASQKLRKIPGVSYYKKDDKFEAYLWKDDQKISLGYYATFEEAFQVRKNAKEAQIVSSCIEKKAIDHRTGEHFVSKT